MTLRWLFSTSSNSSARLRMSKLRPSTFTCAWVMAPVTMPDSMGAESSKPRRVMRPATRSDAKIRMSSSSSEA